jgi:hypothetical protein
VGPARTSQSSRQTTDTHTIKRGRRPKSIAFCLAGLLFLAAGANPQTAGANPQPGKSEPSVSARVGAVEKAKAQLKRDLAELPGSLHKHEIGRWSVITCSIRRTESSATPLTAVVFVDYHPPTVLKYRLSYRYRLRLKLQQGKWYLTSAEDKAYIGDRPPRLETYDDYRPQKLLRSSPEFQNLEACFK